MNPQRKERTVDKFNGTIEISLVVDNYNSEEVFDKIMEKLYELDFVTASAISFGDDDGPN